MAPLKALSPLLLAGFAAARQCCYLDIPIDISSRLGKFKGIPIESNLDAGNFATQFVKFQKNYTADLLEGYQTVSKHYSISAQYCHPDGGSKGKIQLLSHGIGFDKTYWDLSYNDYNYSYINTALSAGYSTLAIDRLGIGNSTHGNPLNEIQAQAEVEALNAVTTKLRSGAIPEIGHAYQKVIHVGHSFGSVQSYWLSALYPENTDGVVLTGYSGAGMFLPYIVTGWNLHSARLNQPLRLGNASNSQIMTLAQQYNVSKSYIPALTALLHTAGIDLTETTVRDIVTTTEILDLTTGYNKPTFKYNYPSGYLVSSDLTSLAYAFLFPSNYDIAFAIQGEQTKQPVTTGELLTIGSAPKMSAFTGPVLVLTGEHDVPFCGGNCYAKLPNATGESIPAGVAASYPKASRFEAVIQPGTGHGLNFQYNATAGYEVVQKFLKSNGLGA